jgi:hypothetical protein
MSVASPPDGKRAAAIRVTGAGAIALAATAAVVAAAAVVLGRDQPGRIMAVAFAAAVCLPGALAAWIISRKPAANAASGVAGPLTAIASRIMPPLVALAWISSSAGTLRDAGAAPLVVVFYLALLSVDILLHVGTRAPRRHSAKAPH